MSVPAGMAFGFLAHSVPAKIILGLLGAMMVLLAVAMLFAYIQGGIPEAEQAEGAGAPVRIDAMGRRYWYRYEHGLFGYGWSALGRHPRGVHGHWHRRAHDHHPGRERQAARFGWRWGREFSSFFATGAAGQPWCTPTCFSSGEVSVHWNILFMTIPAVACGGQISPFINNRVDGEKMKMFLSFVFLLVGGLLLWRSPGRLGRGFLWPKAQPPSSSWVPEPWEP